MMEEQSPGIVDFSSTSGKTHNQTCLGQLLFLLNLVVLMGHLVVVMEHPAMNELTITVFRHLELSLELAVTSGIHIFIF